jgi:hypothetical protein
MDRFISVCVLSMGTMLSPVNLHELTEMFKNGCTSVSDAECLGCPTIE